MNKYIQINLETGTIEATSWVSGEITAKNLIPVLEDFDSTNKKYDFEINDWVYYEPEIIEKVTQPTQLDRIEAKIDKSQQDIIDEYTLSLIKEGIL